MIIIGNLWAADL